MARKLVILTPHGRVGKKEGKRERIGRTPKIGISTTRILERKAFPWRPIVRIIFLSLFVAAVVYAFFSPLFSVQTVSVEGLKNVSEHDVLQQIPRQANLWLFPSRAVAA